MKAKLIYVVFVLVCTVGGTYLGVSIAGQSVGQVTGGLVLILTALVGRPVVEWGEEYGLV